MEQLDLNMRVSDLYYLLLFTFNHDESNTRKMQLRKATSNQNHYWSLDLPPYKIKCSQTPGLLKGYGRYQSPIHFSADLSMPAIYKRFWCIVTSHYFHYPFYSHRGRLFRVFDAHKGLLFQIKYPPVNVHAPDFLLERPLHTLNALFAHSSRHLSCLWLTAVRCD